MLEPYLGPRDPQVDVIWVIVPFSRPEHASRVLANFARQRFAGKRLIVVGNGACGAAGSLSIGGAHWITSAAHPAHARNEALAFIRKRGGGFFSLMDDDDWYGPGYLDEVAGYARSADVVGKRQHFVSLGEGLTDPAPQLLLCYRRYAESDPAPWLTGGAISGWAETAVDFPVVRGTEDLAWCDRMIAQGARLRGLSIYHYLYRRSYKGAEHTYGRTRAALADDLRHRDTLEFPLTATGEIDLEIVTGERAPEAYRVLGQDRFIPVDSRKLSP